MAARGDFDAHLAKGPLLGVYALISQSPLLLSEAVATLRSKVLSGPADFNRDEFVAGEAPASRIAEAAATLPMMAPRRWVHLAQVHRLKAADQAALLPYLERPSPSTVLCLSGDKLDGRGKLGIKLAELKAVFSLEPPRQNQLAGWLQARAKQRKISIEPDAAQLLADVLGVDLGALDLALDKLSLYAGDGEPVTSEHVEAAVAPTRVHSIFDLTDAIGRRDLAHASLTLRNTLSGGESGLLVLAMMARHMRQLITVKELHAAGRTNAVASALGVRPFVADKLTSQARLYGIDELTEALGAVSRADLRLKSSRLEAGAVLDQLLVEMMASH